MEDGTDTEDMAKIIKNIVDNNTVVKDIDKKPSHIIDNDQDPAGAGVRSKHLPKRVPVRVNAISGEPQMDVAPNPPSRGLK